MNGDAGAMPSDVGDVALDEPWHARVVALGARGGEQPGARLGGLPRAADRGDRRRRAPSVLRLLADRPRAPCDGGGGNERDDLTTYRMRAASYWTEEERHGDLEVFPIVCDEVTLLSVLTEVFENWWQHIRFGTLINGAVYELLAPIARGSRCSTAISPSTSAAGTSMSASASIVGVPGRPVDPLWPDGGGAHTPSCNGNGSRAHRAVWMFRMFNGEGAQQMTVLLPNPFLDDDQHLLACTRVEHLALWDPLRQRYLGLSSDPLDRSQTGYGTRAPLASRRVGMPAPIIESRVTSVGELLLGEAVGAPWAHRQHEVAHFGARVPHPHLDRSDRVRCRTHGARRVVRRLLASGGRSSCTRSGGMPSSGHG